MRDDLGDYRISWRLDGEPCEVYLFKRWGGYTHPVLPGDPLTHVEALNTPSLCRAFVRELGGEPLMVRFAAFAARVSELSLSTELAPGTYSVEVADDGSVTPGEPLDRVAAAMADRLIIVAESAVDGSVVVRLRRLEWAYTYDYEYDASGVIWKVNVSSERGNSSFYMQVRR